MKLSTNVYRAMLFGFLCLASSLGSQSVGAQEAGAGGFGHTNSDPEPVDGAKWPEKTLLGLGRERIIYRAFANKTLLERFNKPSGLRTLLLWSTLPEVERALTELNKLRVTKQREPKSSVQYPPGMSFREKAETLQFLRRLSALRDEIYQRIKLAKLIEYHIENTESPEVKLRFKQDLQKTFEHRSKAFSPAEQALLDDPVFFERMRQNQTRNRGHAIRKPHPIPATIVR